MVGTKAIGYKCELHVSFLFMCIPEVVSPLREFVGRQVREGLFELDVIF